MSGYLRVCGGVMLAVVLTVMLKDKKEMGMLLSLAVCCMVSVAALGYLSPVLDFLDTLENLGNLDSDMVRLLLKAAGIGILSEIASLVCTDTGNASMGKAVQLLGTSVILWLSMPLFQALTELLQSILGEV